MLKVSRLCQTLDSNPLSASPMLDQEDVFAFPTHITLISLLGEHASESPRSLVKTQIDWPRLRVANSVGWDEAQERAFLTNTHVRLTLPTGGPCSGNHCSRPSPFRTGILC